MATITIQFFKGTDEKAVPQIRLTKRKSRHSGQAHFRFENPEALLSDDFTERQWICLLDEEVQITNTKIHVAVSRKKGSYKAIEAIHRWRTERDFNRFMGFANRYANKYGLLDEGD